MKTIGTVLRADAYKEILVLILGDGSSALAPQAHELLVRDLVTRCDAVVPSAAPAPDITLSELLDDAIRCSSFAKGE